MIEMMSFDLVQIGSAFMVLFAIIDPLGSVPIVQTIAAKGVKISAWKITLISYALMLAFFFAGDFILNFFGVDISSFAVAGSILLFFMALEMLLDIEIFKNNGPKGMSSIVPLAFPLYAGPGVFTALLTIRSEYATVNLLSALTLNILCVFLVLYATNGIRKVLGEAGIYLLRKFFGLILLAISIKIFVENLQTMVQLFSITQ